MTAQELIDQIRDLCRGHYRRPNEVTINYRHDDDSDVYPVSHTGNALRDGAFWMRPGIEANASALTAQQLIDRIRKTSRAYNVRPEDVEASLIFTTSKDAPFDATSYPIRFVEEDLYDAETNSVLESICLLTESENYDDEEGEE